MQKIKKQGLKRELKEFFDSIQDDEYVVIIAYIKNDKRAYALKRHYLAEIIKTF